jgi:hypothetical protein
MGYFKFGPSNTSESDEEEDYDSEDEDEDEDEDHEPERSVSQSNPSSKLAGRPPCDRPRSHKEPGKEDTKTQKAYQEFKKEEDSEDEDEDEEDEDGESVSLVPPACPTTKSDQAQQKEVVIEEAAADCDKPEDYDSEEDEEDALEREVSWSFWASLARGKQPVPPPKFMGDARRALGPTDTRSEIPAMSTGAVQNTSDGPPTGPEPQPMFTGINPKLRTPENSNREPDSKSIRMREKFLHQLQFLKFSGDRDTKPSTVDWFLQLVAEYVRLGGGVGVSEDDRLINTVLENLSREPRGGKDRAYRWAISWIGSRSGLAIYMAGSYAWVINYGTGKNVYTPPSTVPMHQHYPFSWIEFVDAFTDEFDPERREASWFRKNAFDRGRREPSMFRGEESDWRGKESTRCDNWARDPGRFPGEKFDCRGKESMREQKKREQSQHLREGSAPRHSSRDRRRRTAGFERFSERNTEEPTCSAQQAQSPHQMLVLGERVALLEKHVACLERELKAIHTKSSTVSKVAPEKAQQGLSHCCRVCPQTFGSSTQLHRHLRNSKHFSPPPDPASCSEDVRASDSSAAPSPNEDVPYVRLVAAEPPPSSASCSEDVRASGSSAAPSLKEDVPYMRLVAAEPPFLRTSSGSVPASVSVTVVAPEVSHGAASEDFIPAGPFSSAVLTAPSRDDLQARLPNLAGLNGEIQLKANTGNHTASKSDSEAALKPKRVAPEVALAEMRSLPVPADAGTTKWKKEAENQKALATKWRDRCNTIRELACKIPGYNDPKLATLDADPAEIRPLPANGDATKWQQKAEDWRFLATEWRSRYNKVVNEFSLKTPDCKATDVPPPQKISLHAPTCLSNDYCVEPKPTIFTAGDKDFGKSAASVDIPVVEDYVKKGAVTRMSPKALGKSVMETSGSPAWESALVKPGCLAAVSEPVRLPQLQLVSAPLVPPRACVAAGLRLEDACMLTDDTDELDTTSEESVCPENISNTSSCPASDTLVEVLAHLHSTTAPQHAVYEKHMVRSLRLSTSTVARPKPTAAMEHASFPQLQSYLPSSMPLLGY